MTRIELHAKEKMAKQKSIDEQRAVKVHSGRYYYKGWEVTKDGGSEYPWNYHEHSDDFLYGRYYFAKTMKECLKYIDSCIEDECNL